MAARGQANRFGKNAFRGKPGRIRDRMVADLSE
jgi:hypothetical protein